jgi:hypothetical protein
MRHLPIAVLLGLIGGIIGWHIRRPSRVDASALEAALSASTRPESYGEVWNHPELAA